MALAGVALGLGVWAAVDTDKDAPSDAAGAVVAKTEPTKFTAVVPEWFPATLDRGQYVGAAVCGSCHAAQYARWKDSPHGRAMATPAAGTVLGRFDGRAVDIEGSRITPSRDGDHLYMSVEESGTTQRFEVDLVFASGRQHQVYVTRAANGAYQILPMFWAAIGQAWTSLAVMGRSSADPASPEHWMRADLVSDGCLRCHQSQSQARVVGGRAETRWGDLSINCESCHGPGRDHVAHRSQGSEGGVYRDLSALDKRAEGDLCAQCHSPTFSARFEEDEHGVVPHFAGTLKLPNMRPDGTQLSTIYQYPAHKLSSCYQQGAMKCSSCHDPHGQTARDVMGESAEGKNSDRQCTVCHRDRIDAAVAAAHSRHVASVRCVDCHMSYSWLGNTSERQQRTSDHSISIPRPRESIELGLPNACTTCHGDHEPAWALDALQSWGQLEATTVRPWVATIVRARNKERGVTAELLAILRNPNAGDYLTLSAVELLTLQPPDPGVAPVVMPDATASDPHLRALALHALGVHDVGNEQRWLERGLADDHAFVRRALFYSSVAAGVRSAATIDQALVDILATAPSPPVQEITDLAKMHWDGGRQERALELVELALTMATSAQAQPLHQLRRGLRQRARGH